ncbi:hypothetical protein [Streptomyces spongiae]|uniref:hypothetical protein n=1 Tax=Streptomyces spongiae TaxID=565072 RepID=UPI00188450D3|nr:hypothetical protein [Streptomyces spongiae]
MESVALDAATYRIKKHIFRFAFLVPYGGQNIRYAQDVTESTKGTFTGTITLPARVTRS